MKRTTALFAALIILFSMTACSLVSVRKNNETDITEKTYLYEKEGFGGDFTITIQKDGHFSYYVGMLSSYIGSGSWTLDGDILTLTDDSLDFVNRFRVEGEELVFISEGSTNFMYLKVSDGERFTVTDKSGFILISPNTES